MRHIRTHPIILAITKVVDIRLEQNWCRQEALVEAHNSVNIAPLLDLIRSLGSTILLWRRLLSQLALLVDTLLMELLEEVYSRQGGEGLGSK